MEKAKELIEYRIAKCEKISSSTQNQHDFKHQDDSTESISFLRFKICIIDASHNLNDKCTRKDPSWTICRKSG